MAVPLQNRDVEWEKSLGERPKLQLYQLNSNMFSSWFLSIAHFFAGHLLVALSFALASS